MKKFFKSSLFFMAVAVSAVTFVSCNGGEVPDDGEKEAALKPVVEQYVNKTVIPTYKNLADATIELTDALVALKADKSDATVKAATDAWIETRVHWEQSEAFLFGAVSDFGIDPHIDTWPLDQEQLAKELANADRIANMEGENGAVWVGEYLGNALLGFHGIEYVIFEKGAPKVASKINNLELTYAIAVAGDLRNRCVQLEVAWAGEDNVTEYKMNLVEELELPITASNSKLSYGENMLKAGIAGSTYPSITAATAQILDGAITIADEVGNIKIGTAANESSEDYDANHIESPFSYNSLKDFEDNIVSIENAYLGGPKGSRDENKSVSKYVKSKDAAVDATVRAAIEASYAAIKAIPAPFINNYNTAQADAAVEIIGTDLVDALKAANAIILEQ